MFRASYTIFQDAKVLRPPRISQYLEFLAPAMKHAILLRDRKLFTIFQMFFARDRCVRFSAKLPKVILRGCQMYITAARHVSKHITRAHLFLTSLSWQTTCRNFSRRKKNSTQGRGSGWIHPAKTTLTGAVAKEWLEQSPKANAQKKAPCLARTHGKPSRHQKRNG